MTKEDLIITNEGLIDDPTKTTILFEDFEVNYGRTSFFIIQDDKIVFDCSHGEYGPVTFNLDYLEYAIKKHKESTI